MKVKALIFGLTLAFAAMSFINGVQEYKVDSKQSKLSWVGKKVTGEHSGNISISDGKITSNGKAITGGSFTIDMTSITCTDLTDAGYNAKLIGHLKSDDFFGTEKFPKSTFVITKVTSTGKDAYNIKGNLTIKGITKELEFPATVTHTGHQVKAVAKILVDRTKYDIKYGSGSFFDNLGDKTINDQFEMNIELVATK